LVSLPSCPEKAGVGGVIPFLGIILDEKNNLAETFCPALQNFAVNVLNT
jgi:hypothetical protein